MVEQPASVPMQCSVCINKSDFAKGINVQGCARCQSAQYCSTQCQASDWPTHKIVCGKPPSGPTSVVLMSLEKTDWFDEMNSKLLTALRAKTQVREITTQAAALEFLVGENRHIPAIITDGAFTRKKANAAQLRKTTAKFVQSGGVAVFDCDVPSYTTPDEIHDLFTAFDLPWERGDYHRTTFKLNKAARYINTTGLVQSYSQKALHLSNVGKNDAVYLPTRDSKIQSMVFAPEPIEDLAQTAAAFGRCQKGWVGYTGDVNAEEGTVPLTLAMCGLKVD